MAGSGANYVRVGSPFQDVPRTPRVWRVVTESPACIVPDLSLLQEERSDIPSTPGRYQNVPVTPRTPRTPMIGIRHPFHLIARMRASTTPNVIKSPKSDQVVPAMDLCVDITEGIPSKRQRQMSAHQPQALAVSPGATGFWDVFDGGNIFG